MVNQHNVMNYIKNSIEDNMILNEENTYVFAEYLKENENSIEVEFTDCSEGKHDKTKYRITVENID